jgi:hypothetical protein
MTPAPDPVVALLERLEIPEPVAIAEGAYASGLGLGELALACEAAGVESLDALTNPGKLPVAQQLRLRQAFLWVRVRRLRDSPDPTLRALAETPFEATDAWLPILPAAAATNGHGPANPTIRAARRPRSNSPRNSSRSP